MPEVALTSFNVYVTHIATLRIVNDVTT